MTDLAHQVVLVVGNPPAKAGDLRDAGSIPGPGRALEEEVAAHSSTLAWRILWTEEPGGLQSWVTVGWTRLKRLSTAHSMTDLAG